MSGGDAFDLIISPALLVLLQLFLAMDVLKTVGTTIWNSLFKIREEYTVFRAQRIQTLKPGEKIHQPELWLSYLFDWNASIIFGKLYAPYLLR